VRDLFFYALCAAMLGLAAVTVLARNLFRASLGLLLARNLFRASLGLLGVLLGTAALFLLLKAEMSALVQVMVYIGGILIFVLYAVLLTSELGGRMSGPSPAKVAMAAAAAVASFAYLGRLAWSAASPNEHDTLAVAAPIAALKPLGARLLDPGPGGFLVPFELISALLLAALVGAIAVARAGRPGRTEGTGRTGGARIGRPQTGQPGGGPL
jgi:NADH:ubiquinone oxidoreductase subunit 6 (subunit J)